MEATKTLRRVRVGVETIRARPCSLSVGMAMAILAEEVRDH